MARTIVVTGTTTGIGRGTVNTFAAEGWNVVATVREESDLETHTGLLSVKTCGSTSMMRRQQYRSLSSHRSSAE